MGITISSLNRFNSKSKCKMFSFCFVCQAQWAVYIGSHEGKLLQQMWPKQNAYCAL